MSYFRFGEFNRTTRGLTEVKIEGKFPSKTDDNQCIVFERIVILKGKKIKTVDLSREEEGWFVWVIPFFISDFRSGVYRVVSHTTLNRDTDRSSLKKRIKSASTVFVITVKTTSLCILKLT